MTKIAPYVHAFSGIPSNISNRVETKFEEVNVRRRNAVFGTTRKYHASYIKMVAQITMRARAEKKDNWISTRYLLKLTTIIKSLFSFTRVQCVLSNLSNSLT